MALIKIDTDVLGMGKKFVDVKPTGALFDKAQEIQIELLEDEPRDTETLLDFRKRDHKIAMDSKKFIKQTLSLTTKQWDKINDTVENATLMQFSEYLSMRLQGAEFDTFKDYRDSINAQAEEDAETDPKSSKENEEN